MLTSLSKILRTIETFATNHQQITSFSAAPITDFTAKNWKYSILWVDMQSTTVSISNGEIKINMPVYVMDRVERDFSDYNKAANDTLLSITDVITFFNDKGCELGFDCELTSSVSAVAYEFDDIVVGWKANIVFRTFESFDESKIPLK